MIKRWIQPGRMLGISLALLWGGLKAQTPAKADSGKLVLNLQQAVEYALKNQISMKNALLNEDIAQERIGQIASAGLQRSIFRG